MDNLTKTDTQRCASVMFLLAASAKTLPKAATSSSAARGTVRSTRPSPSSTASQSSQMKWWLFKSG